MVLVLAIVGGAITATVLQQSDTCNSQISNLDAQSGAFGVADFGYSGNDIDLRFTNDGEGDINLTGLVITPANQEASIEMLPNESDYEILQPNNSTTLEAAGGLASYDPGSCGVFEISVNYSETGVENSMSGEIRETV
jgi:hypothetical protein|nr:MAG: hypothetical protein J07AB56_03710 [Candidatus Nanosalinarum sp. J07AB56]